MKSIQIKIKELSNMISSDFMNYNLGWRCYTSQLKALKYERYHQLFIISTVDWINNYRKGFLDFDRSHIIDILLSI